MHVGGPVTHHARASLESPMPLAPCLDKAVEHRGCDHDQRHRRAEIAMQGVDGQHDRAIWPRLPCIESLEAQVEDQPR